MKAKVAFYKASGNLIDKIIRKFTGFKYSHCEIVFGKEWYSSSPRDNGVRMKEISENGSETWDYIDINLDKRKFNKFFKEHRGKGYDYVGILFCKVLPLGLHSKSKMYCSEFIAEALSIPNSKMVGVKELYEILSRNEK